MHLSFTPHGDGVADRQGRTIASTRTLILEPDGTIVSSAPVLTGITGKGGVNGWTTTLDASTEMAVSPSATFTFGRAFSILEVERATVGPNSDPAP